MNIHKRKCVREDIIKRRLQDQRFQIIGSMVVARGPDEKTPPMCRHLERVMILSKLY